MKEMSAFDAVAALLAEDVDPAFPMDIAGALRMYGDERAVPALVAVMDAGADPLPKPEPKKGRGRTVVVGGPPGSGADMPDGRLWNRVRAVMALETFDGEAARKALEAGCANPDIGPFCHAVLWKLTGDERAHGRHVAKAVRAAAGLGPAILGPFLADIEHPNAQFLYEEWKAKAEAAGRR